MKQPVAGQERANCASGAVTPGASRLSLIVPAGAIRVVENESPGLREARNRRWNRDLRSGHAAGEGKSFPWNAEEKQ
jgi:hypothetical protein